MKKELLIIPAVILGLLGLRVFAAASMPLSNQAAPTLNLPYFSSTVVTPQAATDPSLPTSKQPSPSITPQPQPETSATKFVGSVKSDKYHYPSCQWAKRISPDNEIWFSSATEAKTKGYVPCKVCKPPAQ